MRRIIFVFAMTFLVACGSPSAVEQPTAAQPTAPAAIVECAAQLREARPAIDAVLRTWSEADTLAQNTPRISLAAQIERLQSIREQARGLAFPECAASARQSMLEMMNTSIASSIAFLGQKDDSLVEGLTAIAVEQQVNLAAQLDSAPFTARPAPFSGGLDMASSALELPGLTYTNRKLYDGRTARDGVSADKMTTLELIGPAENIQEVSLSVSMNGYDTDRVNAIRDQMAQVLAKVMPDWAEASEWLKTSAKLGTEKQVTAHRGRVVSYQEFNSGGQTYMLSIKTFSW